MLVIGDLSGGERVPAQYSFRLNRQVEQGFSCFENIFITWGKKKPLLTSTIFRQITGNRSNTSDESGIPEIGVATQI